MDTSQSDQREDLEVPTGLRMSIVITWLLYAWAMFGVAVLVLRVFLLATSANMSAGFSYFISRTSSDYLQPFRGIFPPAPISETGYLDVSALFAAITYLFIAWGFKELVDFVQSKIEQNRAEQQAAIWRSTVEERHRVGAVQYEGEPIEADSDVVVSVAHSAKRRTGRTARK